MAMNLSQYATSAGLVGQGWREEEDAMRLAREQQLRTEELNRLNQFRQEMTAAPMPAAPQYNLSNMAAVPMANVSMQGTQPMAPTGGATQPAAPFTPTPMAAAPPYPGMSQSQADRLALLKAPTAALDVMQMPAAAGLNVASQLGTGVVNIGGRLINAATGQPVVRTDFNAPQFSATPFYDRYVRVPEQAAMEQAQAAQRGKLPATPELPPMPQLFAAVEQIESGGKVNAVSPKGAVGPMQTLPGTLRDPGFGVKPAQNNNPEELRRVGQDYLTAMLGRYNNNLDYALAAYNWGPKKVDTWLADGGDPAKLPKETREYIPKVKALLAQGGQPEITAGTPQQAGAPQTGQPAAVAPTERAYKQTDFYLANPQSIPEDMQRAMQMRDEVARMAGMYQRSGMGQQFTEARMKLLDLDNNMTYLQGMQGMQELILANDPRRLGAVWSRYAGVPVAIQPRSDGRYNIMVNGKVTKEGVTSSDISDSARSAFDQTYRQQKAAASTEYNKETYKAQLDIQKEQAKSLADMIKQIAVERVKGNQAQALEWLKANAGYDIKFSNSGDGTVIIKPPGASPYLFNPTGRAIEIDGVKVQSNAAYPIAGLPSLGGAQIR